jgi:glycosyltransferase involved in cell wall biosynthesis
MNEKDELPTVSVIIAAYNAAPWIRQTLDSIIAQTYPVLEIIVVDDGSTDETVAVVKTYGEPVRCELRQHAGQPVARNYGIHVAKGHLIAFVDADDLWHPQKLEHQVELLTSRGLSWVVCDAEWIDINNQKVNMYTLAMPEGDVLRALLMGNFIPSATPVIHRDVFIRSGYFNEAPEARIGEDWDMWLRIAACFPLGVVHEKLASIRYHSTSMLSSASMKEKVHALTEVVNRAVKREPNLLIPYARKALSNIYYAAGVQLVKQNQYREAKEYFYHDLQNHPFRAASLMYLIMGLLGPKISSPLLKLKNFIWNRIEQLQGNR